MAVQVGRSDWNGFRVVLEDELSEFTDGSHVANSSYNMWQEAKTTQRNLIFGLKILTHFCVSIETVWKERH